MRAKPSLSLLLVCLGLLAAGLAGAVTLGNLREAGRQGAYADAVAKLTANVGATVAAKTVVGHGAVQPVVAAGGPYYRGAVASGLLVVATLALLVMVARGRATREQIGKLAVMVVALAALQLVVNVAGGASGHPLGQARAYAPLPLALWAGLAALAIAAVARLARQPQG